MFRHKRANRFFAVLLASLFLLIPTVTFAVSHMNDACTIVIHADSVDMKKLTDYTYSTTVRFKEGDWFSVTWGEKRPLAALYWEWRYIPERALVECLNDAGEVLSSREYADKIRFLTVYPEEGVSEIRMTVLEGKGDMAELFTYDAKQIPPKAVVWEEPLDKADILLVETHGNDDCMIFGAVIPTYTDRGYRIQVADIACDTIGRQRESSGGSYVLGLRNFKTFFEFAGDHTTDYKVFEEKWLSETPDPYERLTAEIRRVRPEVVITHDIETGEGDGSHKLTAEITKQCIEYAADPECFPESAEQYGTWQVKKLYLHASEENPITIDVDTPLESFGGKTAYELSVEAIKIWHNGDYPELTAAVKKRKYDPCNYGLAFSTVGEDVLKNDFLENIPAEALSDYVPPTFTPEPTPEPTPTFTPEPTPEPTQEPSVVSAETLPPEPTPEPEPEPTPEPAPVEKTVFPVVPAVLTGVCAVLLVVCIIALIKVRKRARSTPDE